MNEITDPLDYLIQCCETAVHTGKWKLTKFTILNAKDELKKLREKISELETDSQFKNVAWATINSRGDMFNLSMIYNQFANEDTTISLYRNEKEYKEKYGKLSQ